MRGVKRRGDSMRVILVILALCGAACRLAAMDGWLTDFEEAKARAKKENKDILIDFTGSDWCAPCLRLKAEVFEKEPFKTEAPKHFVLVSLDFPREKVLPENLKKQNDELADQYAANTFPSIILIDNSERMYARRGYEAGGSEKYMAMLAKMIERRKQRDAAFAAAEKLQGLERAKILDAELSALQKEEALIGYDAVINQIIELDSDNKGELKAKYELIKRTSFGRKVLKDIQKLGDAGNFGGALEKCDELLKQKNLPTVVQQEVYLTKAQIHDARGEQDKMIDNLQKAIDADPNSELAKNLKEAMKALKK
jgi:thioredoxin-related protein